MRYKKIYKSIISSVLMTGVVFATLPAFADGDLLEMETLTVAETEKISENANALLPDEEGIQAEDAVATVTADGDFLLPTYLLPGDTATIERTTTVEQVYETPKVIREKEVVVPVEVAKVLKTTAVTELTDKKVVREDDELEALLRQTAPAQVLKLGEGHEKTTVTAKSAPRKLLIPLAAVPVNKVEETVVLSKERVITPSGYADEMAESIQADGKMPFLMPHEIRIKFYPQASAFSGQALKWVRAFALAALKDPRLVVEVRASCAEAELQDARLALVKAALKNAGLSTHQIVVNYTNRPVDTMLLRAVPRQETQEVVVMSKDQTMPKNMSKVQKW